MDYKICPQCGHETPSCLTRCRNCGAKLLDVPPAFAAQPQNSIAEPKRNLFVSIWLWLGFAGGVTLLVLGAYLLVLNLSIIEVTGISIGIISSGITILFSIMAITGYLLLLKWRKRGFYLLAFYAILLTVSNVLMSSMVPLTVMSFYGLAEVLILYAVLQIPKYGKSCWSLLS